MRESLSPAVRPSSTTGFARIKKIREEMRCCVCYSDEKELGNCEVIECASGHATCAECFNEHVKVETAKGAGYVLYARVERRRRRRRREGEGGRQKRASFQILSQILFLSLFFSLFLVRSVRKKIEKKTNLSLFSLCFPTKTSSRFSLSLSLSLSAARANN